MSWQSYVDQNLLGSGQLRRAAIIGLGEGQTLADSGDFLKDLEGKSETDVTVPLAGHVSRLQT